MATAQETNLLEAHPREPGNKNHARRMRHDGKIPAVVYGADRSSLSVTVDPRVVTRILHSESGHNTIFDLALNGQRSKAMIVDWQYEPIKGHLLHIDLKRIAMDKVLKVNVPIFLKGEAEGVKTQGGILEQIQREVEVECLPADIPNHIDVDVSELGMHQVIRVSGLPHTDKIKYLTPEDATVAHVVHIREEVVAAPETAEAAAAAGAAAPAAEGAAPAAPAEPEVIKKGKAEPEAGAPAKKPEAGAKK